VLESLLFALALAVGIVPEMLPAVVGVDLAQARGSWRRRGHRQTAGVDRRLWSNGHPLLDKTGTLTEGRVTVAGAFDAAGDACEAALRRRSKTHTCRAVSRTRSTSPCARRSCVARRGKAGGDPIRLRAPADERARSRRFGTALVTKGALVDVLAVCTTARVGDATVPLGDVRARIDALFLKYSDEGSRVLGVATRDLPGGAASRADESAMTFLGMLVLDDPPRADIVATLADLRSLGITVKIVTGDNARVAAAIAKRVGLVDPVVLTGAEILRLNAIALGPRANAADVSPRSARARRTRSFAHSRRWPHRRLHRRRHQTTSAIAGGRRRHLGQHGGRRGA